MKRLLIFRVVSTGEEIVLPVTPAAYELETERTVEALDMQETGQLNLPGLPALLNKPIECMFPAQPYPFCNAGAVTDPYYYVETFERLVNTGEVLRFVVSDTPVNVPVLIESITYGERDGTNDVYATIRLRGYREIKAPTAERTSAAQNAPRASMDFQIQQTYVTQTGDTFRSICKKFYGDESLAAKLAGYNGFASVGVLQAGRELKIPSLSAVKAAKAAATPEPKTSPDPVPDKEPVPTSDNSQPRGRAQILVRVTAGAVMNIRLTEEDKNGRLLSQTFLTPKAVFGDSMLQASAFVNVGSTCKLYWQLYYREQGWRIDSVECFRDGVHDAEYTYSPAVFTPYSNATVCFVFTCKKGGAS